MNHIDEPISGTQAVARTQPDSDTMSIPSVSSDPAERREFWLDTCREITEMHHASARVLELYRHHGCRFCAPTQSEVQEVLEALDTAMTNWEREHPELFYQTLELNFPLLVRHG
jgi:hypothetical protein